MRSTDERLAAVQMRTRELQRNRRQRNSMLVSGLGVAASLAIIVGFAAYIPGVMNAAPATPSGPTGMYGSIVASGGMLGFVVIGILAFCLGVGVTLLCMRVKERMKEDGYAGAISDDTKSNAPGKPNGDHDGSASK